MSRATAILGLGPGPSVREVKERFRELSLIHHPDAGGDAEKFRELHDAYLIAIAEAAERPCPSCNGRGRVTVQQGWRAVEVPCEDCLGLGYQS